jgi:hypothetical protein
MPQRRRSYPAIALGMTLLLIRAVPAPAHEKRVVGPYRLTIGWGEEPVFTGSRNFVTVAVSDAADRPVTDPGASLAVEVAFGNERITLPLQPVRQRPDEFRAWLLPTRSGTYTFHITGMVKGQTIDATSTCSDKTFHCVTDVAEIQFPAKDPSTGQLAERVSRALPRAERAVDTAARARVIAIAAMAVAALALTASVVLAVQRRQKGS